jgi:hypothetical protein
MKTSVNDIADKLAIRDVLSRYCRGLDRMDKAMAYSVFSADATAHYYDMYEGSGHGFVDWAWEIHAPMDRHSHQISNVLIDLDGDSARSESYVTVALWLPKGSDIVEIVCRGRYLDHWQKRDQQWLIVERKHVLDMQTTNGIPIADAPNRESARDESDPSFEIFTKA